MHTACISHLDKEPEQSVLTVVHTRRSLPWIRELGIGPKLVVQRDSLAKYGVVGEMKVSCNTVALVLEVGLREQSLQLGYFGSEISNHIDRALSLLVGELVLCSRLEAALI